MGENVRVILSVVLCSLAKMFGKYTAKIESTCLPKITIRLKCSPFYVQGAIVVSGKRFKLIF